VAQNIDVRLLHGAWRHVPAEDTADTMVFRPAEASQAPSRGALELSIAPEAKLIVSSIGRGDVPDRVKGAWQLTGRHGADLELRLESGETRKLTVVGLEKDRLLVKKE
jgi:hypothetical protein